MSTSERSELSEASVQVTWTRHNKPDVAVGTVDGVYIGMVFRSGRDNRSGKDKWSFGLERPNHRIFVGLDDFRDKEAAIVGAEKAFAELMSTKPAMAKASKTLPSVGRRSSETMSQ